MKIETLIRKYWKAEKEWRITEIEYPDNPELDLEEEAWEMRKIIFQYYGLPKVPQNMHYDDILEVDLMSKEPLKTIVPWVIRELEKASKKYGEKATGKRKPATQSLAKLTKEAIKNIYAEDAWKKTEVEHKRRINEGNIA